MAVRIANLKILVSANTRGLVGGFSKAKTQVSGFRAGVSTVAKGLSRVLPIIAGVTLGLASFATVTRLARAGLQIFITQLSELDKLGKTASKLGVTTDALQKFHFAAKIAGVDINTANLALQRLVRRMSEAGVDTGEAKAALLELGIEAKTFIKLPLEERLTRLSDAFRRFSDADQLRLGFKLLDSEGVALVNIFKAGSGALDELFKERGELGLFTPEQIARIESVNDNMTRLGIQVNFIKGSIAAATAPILDEFVARLVDVGKRGSFNFDRITEAVKNLAIALAIAADATIAFQKTQLKVLRTFSPQLDLVIKLRKEVTGIATGLGLTDFDTPIADKVRSFFVDVETRMGNIAEKSRETRTNLGSLGELPDKPPEIKVTPKQPVAALIATLPAALEKGTAAAFSLIARTRRGRGIEDVSKWTEATVKELEAQSELLREIIQQPTPLLQPAPL